MTKKRNTFKPEFKESVEDTTVITLEEINQLLNVFLPTQDKEKLISKIKSEEELIKVCKYLNLNSQGITKSILAQYGV